MLSASKERDASDVLRRSTRSSRAKPLPEREEDASGTELSKSTLGQSRSKSSGKGKGKDPIEVIEEADEDDIARAVPPTKQRVKGKENVAHDTKAPRPGRHTKTLRANDTEEEARPPKRRPPKKGKAALDEREESSPDVDSESEVQPVGKRRNRVVESISSGEVSPQETKPKKCQAPIKKVKGKVPIDVPELEDDSIDETKGQSRPIKKKLPKAPAQRQAKARAIEDRNEGSDDEPRQVEQAEKSLPSHDRGKDKAQSRPVSTLESTETVTSSSEEAVIPFPTPVKNSSRVVKGKGPESTGATASHPELCRPRTTSESNHSSNPFVSEGDDVQADVVVIKSDAASAPATPALRTEETILLPGSKPVRDMDDRVLAPLARSSRSPECPESRTLQGDENPPTPPPPTPPRPSSSILSVSSTTSTTKVEGHTDTETLVEPLPVRTNGAQLTEEERIMTVEQWIRREIEVQYERLKRDGEANIRLFKERAEEVRRQIEAL
ncbi:hypothetical protein F5888DRAFT_957072 [Russula emetica]|nr:hypothetical protein F5888DRAFT_957072 [Russula emetica]